MNTQITKIIEHQFVRKYKSLLLVFVGLLLAFILLVILNVVQGVLGHGENYVSNSYDESAGYEYALSAPSFASKSNSRAVVAQADTIESDFYPGIPEQGQAEYDSEVERKVVKNGNLSLVVNNIDFVRKKIEVDVAGIDGFISQASFSERGNRVYENNREYNVRSGSLTIRVPVENFEKAMSLFKEHALLVQNEYVSSQDVTERYVDLQTQIANKEAVEKQYRSLLAKATKIEDILKITQHLNNTRGEIERMQGQLNRLSNQVSLSTIVVSLTAEEDIEVFGVVWSPIQEIKSGFHNFLENIVNFVNSLIKFIFALPILILYAVFYLSVIFGVVYFARKIWKKMRSKSVKK